MPIAVGDVDDAERHEGVRCTRPGRLRFEMDIPSRCRLRHGEFSFLCMQRLLVVRAEFVELELVGIRDQFGGSSHERGRTLIQP